VGAIFPCEQLSAFVCLKMLFLPIRETILSRYLAEWEYINHILYFPHFSEMRNLRFKLGMASLGFVWLGLA